MIAGSRIAMPTSRNTCDEGGEAASQIDSDGGTLLGQMPRTSPAKPSTKNHRVSTNADASRPSFIPALPSPHAFPHPSIAPAARPPQLPPPHHPPLTPLPPH